MGLEEKIKEVFGRPDTTNVEFTTPASNGQKSASINKIRTLWVKPVRAWEQVK